MLNGPACAQCSRCPGCTRTLVDKSAPIWPAPDAAHTDSLYDALQHESRSRISAQVNERPAVAQSYALFAGDLVKERRFAEAKHLLDRAVAEFPGDFLLRVRRAECLVYVGDMKHALLDLEQATSLPAPDLATLAYQRELLRWVAEQSARSDRLDRASPGSRLLTKIASRLHR